MFGADRRVWGLRGELYCVGVLYLVVVFLLRCWFFLLFLSFCAMCSLSRFGFRFLS